MRAYLFGIIGVLLATPASAGMAYETLSRHPEKKQFAAFAETVRSAGENCVSVNRISYLGDSPQADLGFWTVRCGKVDFLVSVANAGSMSTRVVPCRLAETVGARCWVPFR